MVAPVLALIRGALLVAACSLLIGAAASSARAADSMLVIEKSAIEKGLQERLFTDKGRFWLNNTDACNQAWLEAPQVSATGGRLRMAVFFSGKMGAKAGDRCVGAADTFDVTASGKPFVRDGRLGVEDIRIDSLSKEMYRPLLQSVMSAVMPKALDVDLKATVAQLLAGRTAPFDVQIEELVATDLFAEGDRLNVRLQFKLNVR
jgi:hypothetical protein